MENVIDIILQRRSIRRFTDKPVEKGLIRGFGEGRIGENIHSDSSLRTTTNTNCA